ncbi:UNVERIFIED_CONTAM: hypothetical protein Sradi_6036800 [Sesamum radiatum]|uniref:Secreted protein n=1 Tax=Sesamum radiatum TaxID=300843 RepID=A0AAW2KGR5_SESRA
MPALSLNLQRLCFRTVYVASTTGVAMVFPYFNQVSGSLGTINFLAIVHTFSSGNVVEAEQHRILDNPVDSFQDFWHSLLFTKHVHARWIDTGNRDC